MIPNYLDLGILSQQTPSGDMLTVNHLQASVHLADATLTSLEKTSALQEKSLVDLKRQVEVIQNTYKNYGKNLKILENELSALPALQAAISELEQEIIEQKEVIKLILTCKVQTTAQSNIK